ncbi:MAG: patatin-like phospholipase family protein, partial [Pseudomonadota bacterium]|nr:patatin-like phospholipase family protein [Pseudomonadota bacterium]
LPYRQRPDSDDPAPENVEAGFLELPGADMPIVVAARLSLSFPLLLSAVPLYAVDCEMPEGTRTIKRCRFSDGGICSNFPIHLFDSPAPRWPTFGMWLGQRGPYGQFGVRQVGSEEVWLPSSEGAGRGDIWTRFEPGNGDDRTAPLTLLTLLGFLFAAGITAKDWGDRSGMRMAHVRRRVARLNLLPGEGELNLSMKRERILKMAHNYGTAAGRLFVEQYVPITGLAPTQAWSEHQMVRLKTLILSLHGFVDGLTCASQQEAHTEPLEQLIKRTAQRRPESERSLPSSPAPNPSCWPAKTAPVDEAQTLLAMLNAICSLEKVLLSADKRILQPPLPTPELRIRPPI